MLEQKFSQGFRIATLSHRSSAALFPQVNSPMSAKIYWNNNRTSTQKESTGSFPPLNIGIVCILYVSFSYEEDQFFVFDVLFHAPGRL